MKRQRTIFYSWQAWLPNGTNRGFIQKALEDAVKTLVADDSLQVEPVIDRDTAGVSGSPDIGKTILSKIDAADIFVADVSIVTPEGVKQAPNPNVLFELGYAVRALGSERIIQVQNTAYGLPEQLPFDLRNRRTLTYQAREGEADRSLERKKLEGALVEAIGLVLRAAPRSLGPGPIQEALDALQKDTAEAQRKLRAALADVLSRLDAATPDWNANRGKEPEVLLSAIATTPPLVVDFAMLAEATALRMEQLAQFRQPFLEFFGALLDRYSPGREGIQYRDTDFDFIRFLAHELFTSFIAVLLRDRLWKAIAEFAAASLSVTNRWVSDKGRERIWKLSEYAEGLDADRRDLRHELLEKRHSSNALGDLIPFHQFADADYLLYLRGQIERPDDERTMLWLPWSWRALWRRAPDFLHEAETRTAAAGLAEALGVSSVEILRELLDKKTRHLTEFGGPLRGAHPLDQYDFRTIGRR